MKIRTGFVSNSSTTNFTIATKTPLSEEILRDKLRNWLRKERSKTDNFSVSLDIRNWLDENGDYYSDHFYDVLDRGKKEIDRDKEWVKDNKELIFSDDLLDFLVHEFLTIEWECESEEEARGLECENRYVPKEIEGKGFKYFYFGYVEIHSMSSRYDTSIIEDDFYMSNCDD